jgi:hypothetical protein
MSCEHTYQVSITVQKYQCKQAFMRHRGEAIEGRRRLLLGGVHKGVTAESWELGLKHDSSQRQKSQAKSHSEPRIGGGREEQEQAGAAQDIIRQLADPAPAFASLRRGVT